ncbi:MAG TPA: hypothetical protein PLQ76_02930 [bacterium]|nr:hypothetical protein [bacterium]
MLIHANSAIKMIWNDYGASSVLVFVVICLIFLTRRSKLWRLDLFGVIAGVFYLAAYHYGGDVGVSSGGAAYGIESAIGIYIAIAAPVIIAAAGFAYLRRKEPLRRAAAVCLIAIGFTQLAMYGGYFLKGSGKYRGKTAFNECASEMRAVVDIMKRYENATGKYTGDMKRLAKFEGKRCRLHNPGRPDACGDIEKRINPSHCDNFKIVLKKGGTDYKLTAEIQHISRCAICETPRGVNRDKYLQCGNRMYDECL